MSTIAVIGLGQMGLPMAGHLIQAGHRVCGYDVQEAPLQALQAAGGLACASVQEAVTAAEVVLTMLPSGREVAQVLRQAIWPLHMSQPHQQPVLYIDSSTIDVATSRSLAAEAASHGWPMIDAPVSGGVSGAQAGTLTFMVGGEADHVARARPILMAMGKRLFHAGGAGAGQAAKMCNNMLLGILMVGTCEALHLGEALGLEPATLAAIMKESSADNWALRVHPPLPGLSEKAPANQGYQGGFASRLMLKDLTWPMPLPWRQHAPRHWVRWCAISTRCIYNTALGRWTSPASTPCWPEVQALPRPDALAALRLLGPQSSARIRRDDGLKAYIARLDGGCGAAAQQPGGMSRL